jgi:diguanylate cyclase (GGDEF)-like protein/PAS domain S-box-containing protein
MLQKMENAHNKNAVVTVPAGMALKSYLSRLIWICIAPLLLLATFLAVYHVRTLKDGRDMTARNLAANVVTTLDQVLASRIAVLSTLALSPGIDNIALRSVLLEEARRFKQTFGNDVILADSNLQMLFNTRISSQSDLPKVPHPKGRSATATALETGKPAIGDIVIGPIAKRALIAVAVPVIRQGKPTFLLLTTIDTDYFGSYLEQAALPKNWRLELQDGLGEVIAERMHGSEPVSIRPVSDLSFSAKSQVSPWSVHVYIPQTALDSQVIAGGLALFVVLTAATLASYLGGKIFGNQLNVSLQSIVRLDSTTLPKIIVQEVEKVRNLLIEAARKNDTAVASLLESQEQLLQFVKNAPVAIALFDKEMRYLAYSQRWVSEFAIDERDIIGHSQYDLMPAMAEKWRALIESEMGGKSVRMEEDQVVRVDGEIRWLCWEVRQWATHEGLLGGIIVFSEDITNRKASASSIQQLNDDLSATLRAIPDLLFEVDLQGTYYAIWAQNPALLAQQESLLLGHQVRDVMPPDAADIVMAALQEAQHTGQSYGRVIHLPLPDEQHWFELSISRKSTAQGPTARFIVLSRDVTDRKKFEIALKESEFRWKFAVEGSGGGLWDWDLLGGTVYLSRIWKEMIGHTENEVGNDLSEWKDRVHPEDLENTLHALQTCLDGVCDIYVSEHRFRCKDGSYIWVLDRGMVVNRNVNGQPLRMIGMHTDITLRKQAETDLRIAAAAFDSQEGMMVTDAHSVILKVNRAFSEITGYSAEEVVGKTPKMLQSGRHDADFYAAMWESVNETGTWQGEVCDKRKNGEEYQKWLIISAVKSQQNEVTHYVGIQYDITERKKAEETIKELAFYDTLTHLPNRLLLQDRLKQAMTASNRNSTFGALFFVDLDHFKILNDTLGHDIGDQLLVLVARRLVECVREGDTVARLGGDEFVVVLENLSTVAHEAAAQTESIGTKILQAVDHNYHLANQDYRITTSIGATLFSGHDTSSDELLKQADLAMYKAKDSGHNTLRFFDPQMQIVVLARAAMERDLREALHDQQFLLYYQPQIAADKITGSEALLRWLHPTRGLVPPGEFIPLAEDTGLILPIGSWVLNTACRQLAAWASNPTLTNLTVSVNVSVQQFRQHDFVEQVQKALFNSGANPHRLKIELTESLLVDNLNDIVGKMHAIKSFGVGFSLDDFGTGYSSLSYLKLMPLDQLKIDQSFVRDVLIDPNDAAIAKTIVGLAQSLGFGVIAEGVETEGQRDFLEIAGCHAYQGYFFSRPLPVQQFENYAGQI